MSTSPPKNSKLYESIIGVADKFVPDKLRPFWVHPAGPKTVFFWAPFIKWGLVIAALGDINRPIERVSYSQSLSLALTGLIWSRYSIVIIPVNWSLFSVNIFVALTNAYQIARLTKYNMEMKNKEPKD